MRIEMLATGDELVSGVLADTNTTWFGGALFSLGERLARTTVIGDRLDDLVSALRELAARADLVVVSGGLGPTLDDLTVDGVCEAFDLQPVVDSEQLERIRARFHALGRTLTPNNERQARVPDGAEVLGNEYGTATAFALEVGEPHRTRPGTCELWFLPGVPTELQGIVGDRLLPRLRRRIEAEGVHRCAREVRCFGIPESHMDQAVVPLLAAHPHVRYGTRVPFPDAHVRLLAEGSTADEAQQRCDAIERDVRAALGDVVFGGEGETLAGATLAALRQRGWTVCFAESLTGGLASAALAAVPGASDVLLGSSVTYAESLKERWLDVPQDLLERHGAVSEACAVAMAEGALARSGADVAVSLTGFAGPDAGDDAHPRGTVFAAIAGGGGPTSVVRQRFLFGRNDVRRIAAHLALDLLRRRALGLRLPG
ncbi:CinA family nicotinamide mononucleotide deamidase-related protein [Vulgatibacter incomptus]|uniref:CinA-like protein n=1 Tax=Vulgatibacter incomptus TaxID=1391653 RepID=A0A0K1PE36_9BACT|nr:CinA family nicotinamide mononucleotide deamidase-related protein [Vulgatibacter incomptus]AKU91798.1 C-terminal domain of CinA type S [Vulgatibacter incomptus]